MNKNIPHPAGSFKHDLGRAPEAWANLGVALRYTRRTAASFLTAGPLTPTDSALLRYVELCARIELHAAKKASRGGRE